MEKDEQNEKVEKGSDEIRRSCTRREEGRFEKGKLQSDKKRTIEDFQESASKKESDANEHELRVGKKRKRIEKSRVEPEAELAMSIAKEGSAGEQSAQRLDLDPS